MLCMFWHFCHKLYIVGDGMENNSEGKKIIRFFLSYGFFTYLALPIGIILMTLFKVDLSGNSVNGVITLQIAHGIILSILLIFLYRDKLIIGKKLVKDMGSEKFIKKVIISGLLFFLVKIGSGVIVAILTAILGLSSATVDNQELIEKMMESVPFIMIISTVICAPLTEELIFRGGLGDVIKNKKVYIAVSGLIFGLIHVTDSVVFIMEILLLGVVINRIVDSKKAKSTKATLSIVAVLLILLIFSGIYTYQFGNLITKLRSLDMIEVVGSITYIAMGIFLAYLYKKHDNIYYTIGVHAFNNLVSMLLLLQL